MPIYCTKIVCSTSSSIQIRYFPFNCCRGKTGIPESPACQSQFFRSAYRKFSTSAISLSATPLLRKDLSIAYFSSLRRSSVNRPRIQADSVVVLNGSSISHCSVVWFLTDVRRLSRTLIFSSSGNSPFRNPLMSSSFVSRGSKTALSNWSHSCCNRCFCLSSTTSYPPSDGEPASSSGPVLTLPSLSLADSAFTQSINNREYKSAIASFELRVFSCCSRYSSNPSSILSVIDES